MVMSWAGLMNVEPASVKLGSEMVGVPFPVAPGADSTTSRVPDVTVWLLVVVVVKTACAPAPTRLRPARLNTPVSATVLSFMPQNSYPRFGSTDDAAGGHEGRTAVETLSPR
jgi:hypothetical protein